MSSREAMAHSFEKGGGNVKGSHHGPFAPDRALCPECLREIFDSRSRRHRYPFTCCGNCGPRYSVTVRPPFDRSCTTMAPFPMCGSCRHEFQDPQSRRHQAPLISCPECGPLHWIEPTPPPSASADVIFEVAQLLKAGKILAIKGIGGFHLACRADDEQLVQRLRRRIQRRTKPMSVMVPDLDWARRLCDLNPMARGKLKDLSAPIVLAPKRRPEVLAHGIAPDSPDYGLTLPSTPFRHLLMDALKLPLVMTASTFAGESIVASNEDARERLTDVADYLVLHDREIEMPCEDTVMRVLGDDLVTTRRSWGQAPRPIVLEERIPSILGLGATHRGTLALGYDRWIVLSQHLGELDRPAGQREYRRTLEHLRQLHGFEPEILARDLHPHGLGRRLAEEMALPVERVQHHHAHIASVMAEHGLQGPVLGLALDQSGWGEDGSLWGSEFLVGDARSMQRVDHGPEFCLPGGQSVFLHPWRTAAGLLWELKGEDVCAEWLEENAPDPVAAHTVLNELRDKVNCVRACGLGLLYDALAAIVGILENTSFEGQAPMTLERLAGPARELEGNGLPDPEMPTRDYFAAVLDRLLFAGLGNSDSRLDAAYIQGAVARWVARRAATTAQVHGLDIVAASGGCLLNAWLRRELRSTLGNERIHLYTNELLPPTDGGIAAGQILVAARRHS